jgi:hypothetical protein
VKAIEDRPKLHYGIYLPNFGEVAYARTLTDLAIESESAGWDGFFLRDHVLFQPAAKQKPRIPIWVGGFWPNKAPFRRAAKYDGVIPLRLASPIRPEPKDLRDILEYIRDYRTSTVGFDVAVIGRGTGKSHMEDVKKLQLFAEAGMTWWLESFFLQRNSYKEMRKRIRQGPPRIS